MDYRELLKEQNNLVQERYELARARLKQIALLGKSSLAPELNTYFCETALFLYKCADTCQKIREGAFRSMKEEELRRENEEFYHDILPKQYESSYANPAYAVLKLGEEYGRILSFLYTELRGERVYAFEQDIYKITILNELFLEIYGLFENDDANYRKIRETIYWFFHDNAEVFTGWRVRELFDPELDFATSIIMESDLSDLRYLYAYGEYISDNEREVAAYLNSLPQEEIEEIAFTFTDGYREGFALKNVDLSLKDTVNIRFNIGFERIIRAAVLQFKEMGLKPVIYRAAVSSMNKKQNLRIGYVSTSPNEQFDYDHRFDNAVYFDKRMMERKLVCMRKAFEEFEEAAAGFAGPAVFEVFGDTPFEPVAKDEAYHLSERQQMLSVEYSTLSNTLMNEFIDQEERSFTCMACPMPSIGPDFLEIFAEVKKVNTLDKVHYRKIQQKMIDLLDQADYVKIMGRGRNMTNLTVKLIDLEDPETQTKFENCLADVNIPVGEVFTSPMLKGTSGLLHVTEVFLSGLCYKDLRLRFEDGMITEYSCGNFPDPEDGKRFIRENLLFNHETLPMGEFAIGTNTTAYVMATRYDIVNKLPILIAEKMGPHLAVGDTCYSYCEDVRVFNPDGKEIVARDNECSLLRKEEPKKAYFNCHTDITIPYEELDRIVAGITVQVGENTERTETPIILDGRFVLDGTLDLNKPFSPDSE